MKGIASKIPSKLSHRAAELLGQLTALADEEGTVEVTRAELAKILKVSIPTIARALRELVTAGELELVERGGGRSRPSRYRIVRIARELVPQFSSMAGVRTENLRREELKGQAVSKKPYHTETDHKPDQEAAIQELFGELGRNVVIGASAFLNQAVRTWRTLPTWQRGIIAGVPLSCLGLFLGKRYGGWLGGTVGAVFGLTVSILLVSVFPLEQEAAYPVGKKTVETEKRGPPSSTADWGLTIG